MDLVDGLWMLFFRGGVIGMRLWIVWRYSPTCLWVILVVVSVVDKLWWFAGGRSFFLVVYILCGTMAARRHVLLDG